MDSSDGTRVSEFCTALSLWVKPEHNPKNITPEGQTPQTRG